MINVLALNNANLVIYWFLVGEIEPILKRQRVDAVSYHQIDKPLAALLSLNEKEKSMDGCFLPPPPLVTGITRENLSRGVRVGRMTHFFSPSSRLDPVSKNMFFLLLKKKNTFFVGVDSAPFTTCVLFPGELFECVFSFLFISGVVSHLMGTLVVRLNLKLVLGNNGIKFECETIVHPVYCEPNDCRVRPHFRDLSFFNGAENGQLKWTI